MSLHNPASIIKVLWSGDSLPPRGYVSTVCWFLPRLLSSVLVIFLPTTYNATPERCSVKHHLSIWSYSQEWCYRPFYTCCLSISLAGFSLTHPVGSEVYPQPRPDGRIRMYLSNGRGRAAFKSTPPCTHSIALGESNSLNF